MRVYAVAEAEPLWQVSKLTADKTTTHCDRGEIESTSKRHNGMPVFELHFTPWKKLF